MEHIRAVIFDLDDTLVNRKAAFRNFCVSFIEEHFEGRELPDSRENMIGYMTLLDRNGYCDRTAFYSPLIEKWGMKNRTVKQLCDNHENEFHKFTLPDADMEKVLDYLAPKYKLGIITNGVSKTQNGKIDRVGIRDRFRSVIVSGEAGVHKPDGRIFRMSCSALGVKAGEAIYVGDHYENDISGAKRAGLYTVWYTDDPGNPPYCDYKINRLSEILNIL